MGFRSLWNIFPISKGIFTVFRRFGKYFGRILEGFGKDFERILEGF